jgi:hypothetical protein
MNIMNYPLPELRSHSFCIEWHNVCHLGILTDERDLSMSIDLVNPRKLAAPSAASERLLCNSATSSAHPQTPLWHGACPSALLLVAYRPKHGQR